MTRHFAHDIITTTPSGTPVTVGDIQREAREKLAALGQHTAAPAASDEALATDGEVFHGAEDYDAPTTEATTQDAAPEGETLGDDNDGETFFAE